MKNKLKVLMGGALGLAPLAVFAQIVTGDAPSRCISNVGQGSLLDFMCRIGEILGFLLPLLIALAVVYFVWGVIQYLIAGDEEKKKEGRSKIVYGIIGLVIIIGLWGLVRIVASTFGLQNRTNVSLPTVPFGTPTTR